MHILFAVWFQKYSRGRVEKPHCNNAKLSSHPMSCCVCVTMVTALLIASSKLMLNHLLYTSLFTSVLETRGIKLTSYTPVELSPPSLLCQANPFPGHSIIPCCTFLFELFQLFQRFLLYSWFLQPILLSAASMTCMTF